MNLFAVNVVLALIWTALGESFSVLSLFTGFLVSFGALWISQPLYGHAGPYFMRTIRIVDLALYFLYDLVMSSLRVAWDVLTPQDLSSPRIVEMPLEAHTDLQILLVTNLISLTPGTLSLDVSADRRILYVHAMFGDDPDKVVRDLKAGMERKVMRVFEE